MFIKSPAAAEQVRPSEQSKDWYQAGGDARYKADAEICPQPKRLSNDELAKQAAADADASSSALHSNIETFCGQWTKRGVSGLITLASWHMLAVEKRVWRHIVTTV